MVTNYVEISFLKSEETDVNSSQKDLNEIDEIMYTFYTNIFVKTQHRTSKPWNQKKKLTGK